MATLDLNSFVQRLIAETLFYDEEFAALGNLSLIDTEANQERFIASYAPDDGIFVIEEATEWEDYTPGEDDDIGYALAVDSQEHSTHETQEDAAAVLLDLAATHGLQPSITLLFEEDEPA